jgi:ribonuclease HI
VQLTIHVDGGARGNPGPAGAGVLIRTTDGRLIHEAGYFLGLQTNNVAEYTALILALRRAIEADSPDHVAIYSDSELVVRQITGEYRVRNARLKKLHNDVQMLLLKLSSWTIHHVPRNENEHADQLANRAMDEERDIVLFDDQRDGPHDRAASETKAEANHAGETRPDEDERAESRAVRLTVTQPPDPQVCPAGDWSTDEQVVEHTLPADWCLHAAQSLIPTLLALQRTTASDFAALPEITVRCGRAGCGACFQIERAR